jgi:hypothetical protein
VREQRLEQCEKNNEVILQEAARNGLTVSYNKLLHKGFEDRISKKSMSDRKPKSVTIRSKSQAAEKENIIVVNKKHPLF